MNLKLSPRPTKRYAASPERKASPEWMKRQRIFYNDFLNWFTPKHYPSVFLDNRLKSRFNQQETSRKKQW